MSREPPTGRDPRMSEELAVAGLPQAEGRVVEVAPTKEPATPLEWVRANLFSGPFNAILTLAAGGFVGFLVYQVVRFVFFAGEWEVIRANLRGYMVGGFPVEELWRVWTCLYLVLALAGLSAGAGRRRMRWSARRIVVTALAGAAAAAFLVFAVKTALVWALIGAGAAVLVAGVLAGRVAGPRLNRALLIAWLVAFPVVVVILRGFGGVDPRLWGGFMLNILTAVVAIFVSFPIGIAFALGRRSSFPAIRAVSIGYIELFRAVPLVVWLLFGQYVLELLLPPQIGDPSDIVKAMMMMVLFSSAYVAEIVRGGLQGVQFGQIEAARALGLPVTRMIALVVLPQALRATIPAMISHFISLFKDTSLLGAIEFTDALAAARRSATSLQFLGLHKEALLTAALMFWAVAFSMSRWSQRLEVRLGVGER